MKFILVALCFFGWSNFSYATKPNIVLIISDDQGWMDYSMMEHPQIETPNIDKLAKEGAVFKRGYVPTGLCRPSLMTMVTGLYAHDHGVIGNDQVKAKGGPAQADLTKRVAELDSLPKLLQKEGYLSHQSGKWWEGSCQNGGFTHGMTQGAGNAKHARHGDEGLEIGRETMEPIRDFLKMSVGKKKPFFLFYSPMLPHDPHTPPQRLLDKYNKKINNKFLARYYAMCEWFDETCGELMNILDENKVRNNTIVVYLADNGWITNDKNGRFAPRSKQTPYEGGVRTPIIYNWPGQIKPADRPELAGSIDIYPTLLKIAGITAPTNRPGLDISNELLTGKQIQRNTLFGETFAHDMIDPTDFEKTLIFRWCIEGTYKLILTYDGEGGRHNAVYDRKDKRPQLYDLSKDPHEKNNLAASQPKLVQSLAQKIEAWYPLKQRKAQTQY